MPTEPDIDGLRDLLAAVDTLFPDLAFLGSEGVLALKPDGSGDMLGIRVEAPRQPLELQSVGMVDEDGQGVSTLRGLTTSSRQDMRTDGLDLRQLLDFGQPRGTVISAHGDPAWLELHFNEPRSLREIRLRNV